MDIFTNNFFWYFGVTLILYFVIFKVIPFFKNNKGVTGFSERNRLNKLSSLPPDEYKRLSIGAIYSEMQSAYINSLTTGLDNENLQTITNNWWGIYNTESALETLTYLKEKGYNFYFPAVYQALLTDDKEEQISIITSKLMPQKELSEKEREQVEEDIQKAYSQLTNLQETFKELKRDKIISNREDIGYYGVQGWDYGRLSYMSRICFDAGYIDEEQAWSFINDAYELANRRFDSWEDFAKSYVIGRAAWGGIGCANSEVAAIADNLLTEPDSPWVQMAW